MRHFRLLPLALGAALLPLGAAASAQEAPGQGIADLAATLAYQLCPDYLAGRVRIEGNPQLTSLGFAAQIIRSANPQMGTMEIRSAVRDDGEVSFGGAPGKLCQVNVYGAKASAALDRFRAGLVSLPYKFEPDPANSGQRANGATVDTRMTRIQDRGNTLVLRVQFVQGDLHGTPIAGFQIFGMNQ
ncbi:hypothetical protein [Sphingomonas sp.]|uniref:hypothetical protein n=1 Tax=Sphingomonas sp. TaxID=28214 RepID=UPI001B087B79|nr:hypothetical protein [Sphingomonas sp.]MBO9715213.1 hypothetical protein [Sphingomonas sp.]